MLRLSYWVDLTSFWKTFGVRTVLHGEKVISKVFGVIFRPLPTILSMIPVLLWANPCGKYEVHIDYYLGVKRNREDQLYFWSYAATSVTRVQVCTFDPSFEWPIWPQEPNPGGFPTNVDMLDTNMEKYSRSGHFFGLHVFTRNTCLGQYGHVTAPLGRMLRTGFDTP